MTCYDITTQTEYDTRKNEPGAHFHIKGNARIRLDGSSSGEFHGSSRGEFYDSSSGEFHGSSRGEFYGSSSGEFYDSSSGAFHGSSSGEFYDSSSGEFHGSSRGEFHGSSSGEFHGSSSGAFYDSSSGEFYDSSSGAFYGSSSGAFYGSSSGEFHDSSSAVAGKYAAIHKHPDHTGTITGGVVIEVPDMNKATAAEWLDFWGLRAADGKAVVFKAVDQELNSGHGVAYPLGKTVTAPDWADTRECGNGLHFGPTPRHARRYFGSAARYLACEVDLAETVALGDKVKTRSCRVLYEVDVNGRQVTEAVTTDA